MRAWWGMQMRKGQAEMAGPPVEGRRRTRTCKEAITTMFCVVSLGRPSVGQPTGRGEGVSSQTTNARKTGDLLQRFSRRSTREYV